MWSSIFFSRYSARMRRWAEFADTQCAAFQLPVALRTGLQWGEKDASSNSCLVSLYHITTTFGILYVAGEEIEAMPWAMRLKIYASL